jgi:CheY-like chemotaxis protein
MGAPRQILLVEDNPGDVDLTRECLESSSNRVHVAQDGIEALRFMRKQGPHQYAPRPDLVLLDLNLPRKDGRHVLAEVKADPDLRAIPVVVLTSSQTEQDVCRAFELHANGFFTKPMGLDPYMELMGVIRAYWLEWAALPTA